MTTLAVRLAEAPVSYLDPAACPELIEAVRAAHPATEVFRESTLVALRRAGVTSADLGAVADRVTDHFMWTQFVSKAVMMTRPIETIDHVQRHIDVSRVEAAVADVGGSLLSCYHFAGFPLVAVALSVSTVSPLISKARRDALERGRGGLSDSVVYTEDRSAGLRIVRALKAGRSVWMLVDVVLAGVRTVRVPFMGTDSAVSAGLETLAARSGRPCIPLSWSFDSGRPTIGVAEPLRAGRSSGRLLADLVADQAATIRRNPDQWLEWYSLLEESSLIRAEVKAGSDALWAEVQPRLVGAKP